MTQAKSEHHRILSLEVTGGFLQSVRLALAKSAPGDRKPEEDLDHAIRQIVSDGISNLLDRPNVSILSEGFLAEVRGWASAT